ncbi:hypothetical protein Hamer_G019676 [Homarus americanus]|uniref:Uncharacterized protein n=1 Tax=Homarus americanus TaxID=6706 RepID=A0A8J5JS79_HOMAM|nr:hypothetical protein Hamer_G019676 [Homarus americanus]
MYEKINYWKGDERGWEGLLDGGGDGWHETGGFGMDGWVLCGYKWDWEQEWVWVVCY